MTTFFLPLSMETRHTLFLGPPLSFQQHINNFNSNRSFSVRVNFQISHVWPISSSNKWNDTRLISHDTRHCQGTYVNLLRSQATHYRLISIQKHLQCPGIQGNLSLCWCFGRQRFGWVVMYTHISFHDMQSAYIKRSNPKHIDILLLHHLLFPVSQFDISMCYHPFYLLLYDCHYAGITTLTNLSYDIRQQHRSGYPVLSFVWYIFFSPNSISFCFLWQCWCEHFFSGEVLDAHLSSS